MACAPVRTRVVRPLSTMAGRGLARADNTPQISWNFRRIGDPVRFLSCLASRGRHVLSENFSPSPVSPMKQGFLSVAYGLFRKPHLDFCPDAGCTFPTPFFSPVVEAGVGSIG